MRRGNPMIRGAVLAAVVLSLAVLPAWAGQRECYDYHIATKLMELTRSPGAVDAYLQHSTISKDSMQVRLDAYWSDTYKVAKFVDAIGKLDNGIKNVGKFMQMMWDGGDCVTVTFDIATISFYYPTIYGVCGPETSLSGGLTVGGRYMYSGGNSRYMPIVRLDVDGEANLQCGYICFRVYGGIHFDGEVGFEPYSYHYLESYAKLTIGPAAHAEVFCVDVWSWEENLYTGKLVFKYLYVS